MGYLQNLAASGSILSVDVRNHYSRPSQRATGLSDAWRKVAPETPHQERATEGQIRKKKLQGEAMSGYGHPGDYLEGESPAIDRSIQ